MKHHVVGNHVMGIHVKWGTAVVLLKFFLRKLSYQIHTQFMTWFKFVRHAIFLFGPG